MIIGGIILVTLLLGAGTVLYSQEEPSDTFLRELERLMIRDGWNETQTGELTRYLHTYRYENLQGVDPEVVALALQYAGSREGKSLGIPEMAVVASQVMNMAGEMASLGFETQDIGTAALNGVRFMLTNREQLKLGADSPETALQLQEQIRLQVRDSQSSELKSQIQDRTRTSNPHDPEEWAPSGPAGSPGGNDPAGTPGAGSGTGVDGSGGGQHTGT